MSNHVEGVNLSCDESGGTLPSQTDGQSINAPPLPGEAYSSGGEGESVSDVTCKTGDSAATPTNTNQASIANATVRLFKTTFL